MRNWNLIAPAFAAVLLAARPVLAVPPTDAQKCESSFELASAKDAGCRLVAEAKFTKTNDGAKLSAALAKCSTKLSDALGKALTKFGGGNCTSEAPAAFDAYLAQCSDDVEAASRVGGTLPDYVGDLAACNGDLATCTGDLAACAALLPARPLKTGQTTSYGAGDDGDLQLGIAQNYVDNGDGTITDTKTSLMWEKKSDDGSIHDKDNTYSWCVGVNSFFSCDNGTNALDGTAATTLLVALNGGGGFAGYTDWRLPNRRELESLTNLGTFSPSTLPVFNTNCGPNSSGNAGCTVTACSCTAPTYYWSSSTYASPQYAWLVDFDVGSVTALYKYYTNYVRAIRSGL